MISLCDTGPLIAYLNRRDKHHGWAVSVMQQVRPPLLTCEPVLTEAAYFLREDGLPVDALFELLARDALRLNFEFSAHRPRLRTLMGRFRQMDLADACLVAMTEQHRRCQVLTIDRKDFTVYRRNDREVVPFIAPPQR